MKRLGPLTVKELILILTTFCLILFLLQYLTHSTDTKKNQSIRNDSFEFKSACLSCHFNNKLNENKLFSKNKYDHLKKVTCSGCHRGDDKETLSKQKAHKNMIKIPGNLADVQMTCAKCHDKTTSNVTNSLMARASGMIGVNHYIFGKSKTFNSQLTVKDLKNDHADSHLKQLCTKCHLGTPKNKFGKITQLSRGGGCLACHLDESSFDKGHPKLTIQVKNHNCFGCHSRSSRISTNFEGWHEHNEVSKDPMKKYRKLEDGRTFIRKQEDIHHSKGFLCIDCHTARGIMGDGKKYNHQEQQVEVKCIDCHLTKEPKSISFNKLDKQTKKIVNSRKIINKNKIKYVLSSKSQKPFSNIFKNLDGNYEQRLKIDKRIFKLNKISTNCLRNKMNHQRLNCNSCHSTWAPQCVSCHTQLDSEGKWNEYSGTFLSDLPSLGIQRINNKEIIKTFVPGMIMTLSTKKKNLNNSKIDDLINDSNFHRLFSPISPHTTQKQSRSCKSCHQNPNALGYGRGEIDFKGPSPKSWKFIPYFSNSIDNLPADSWIPFLVKSNNVNTTRDNTRSFNIYEQKAILNVGRCLKCHRPSETNIFNNFNRSLKKMPKNCFK